MTPIFPVRFYTPHGTPDGRDWYWSPLCVVYDNEQMGRVERLLDGARREFKAVDDTGMTVRKELTP